VARRLTVMLGVVGVFGAMLGTVVSAPAADGTKTKAKLFLSYFPESDTRQFTVILKSDKAKCIKDRAVAVSEKLDGPDELMGEGETDQDGLETILNAPADNFEPGSKFTVKAPAKGSCKAAKKTITVGPPGRA